jgi:hypothetical protein
MDLDLAKDLHTSGFNIADLTVFFDFDTQEEFLAALQGQMSRPYQVWFGTHQPSKLTSQEIQEHRETLEKKRLDPIRAEKQLIHKILEWSKLGKVKQIVSALGKTESELDVITEKHLGKPLKKVVEQHRDTTLLDIGVELLKKSKDSKDPKGLQFLAEKLLEEMKPEVKDTNININDNRQVKIIEMPKPEQLEDYKNYWARPELDAPSTEALPG